MGGGESAGQTGGVLRGPDVDVPVLVDVGVSDGAPGPALVWRLAGPVVAISSAIVGGGLGLVSWVLNATVDENYSRLDPEQHLGEIADRLGLSGRGVAFMTAVDVASRTTARSGRAIVTATVGVRRPVWAATDPTRQVGPIVGGPGFAPGTINAVAAIPQRLSDAALVNAVATMTEAKVQALHDLEVPGTGTATDAICVLCPANGVPELFGGPRSVWGRQLANATYEAVASGIGKQRR